MFKLASDSNHYINHSCDPNCELQYWDVNGTQRIGLFALKFISKSNLNFVVNFIPSKIILSVTFQIFEYNQIYYNLEFYCENFT